MVSEEPTLPPVVTFQSGAQLLMDLGIVGKITHQGIRHIAITDADNWPFGPDKKHQYWPVSNATVMETEPFLDYFRERARRSKPE